MELSPPVTILLLAASGYIFCNWCHLIKFDVLRDTGQRLYLTAAVCGVSIYLVTYILYSLQKALWVDLLHWPVVWHFQTPLESWLAQLALGFSLAATFVINRFPGIKERSLEKAWHRNDMDALCSEAIAGTKPVTVTLDTRKVYVGLVFDSLEPGKEANLTLLPLYSGYRNKDTLELHISRKYSSVDDLLGKMAAGEGVRCRNWRSNWLSTGS